MRTEEISLKVDGNEMRSYVARPDTAERGIIVLQEAFGVNDHIQDVTRRFAAEGYLAIAPELYHRAAPGIKLDYTESEKATAHREALTEEGQIVDIASAFEWLREQGMQKIAAVGYCMGGRASFLAASSLALNAAVSYYGGRIAPNLLPRAKDIKAPMLFFWGGLDRAIPHEERRAVIDTLEANQKNYTNVEFSNAGHGFFCDKRASYQPDAAHQAWVLTKEFLGFHLKHI